MYFQFKTPQSNNTEPCINSLNLKNFALLDVILLRFPPSIKGQLPCLMALCRIGSEPVVGYNQGISHTPQSFLHLLEEIKMKSILNQRLAKWETVLTRPQLTVLADSKTCLLTKPKKSCLPNQEPMDIT